MDTPKVTVIIPCHNQAKTLRRAVESALDADEIIVFRDADETRLAKLIGVDLWQSDKIIYDTSRSTFPLGVCNARNACFDIAAWDDLIIPLDADDYFLPDGINRLKDAWRPNTFTYGGWRNDDFEIFPARQPKRISQQNLCQATMLFHRDDWLKVGGYDPDFNIGWEDFAFQCALINAGVEAIRVDYPIHHYSSGGKRSANALKYKDFLIKLMVDKYPAVFETKVKA
jgi:glycosyltransferase involved in cell wall biosynthesis